MNISGNGAVLPPDSGEAAGTLPGGGYEVRIDGHDESGMVRCVYPGGFVRHHQAEAVEELAAKVTGQLRGRYGASDVRFAKAPKALKAGESFKVGG